MSAETISREAVRILADLGLGVDFVMPKTTLSYELAWELAREYHRRDQLAHRDAEETVSDYFCSLDPGQKIATRSAA